MLVIAIAIAERTSLQGECWKDALSMLYAVMWHHVAWASLSEPCI
jgi:hypothetical protein